MSDARKKKEEEEILKRQREIASRLKAQLQLNHSDPVLTQNSHEQSKSSGRKTSDNRNGDPVKTATTIGSVRLGKEAIKSSSSSVRKTSVVYADNCGVKDPTRENIIIDLTSPSPQNATTIMKRKEKSDTLTALDRPSSPKRLKSDSCDNTLDRVEDLSKPDIGCPAINPSSALKRAPIRKREKILPLIDTDTTFDTDQSLKIASSSMTTKNHRKSSTYPNIEFEDFWKDVRSWDFLRDFNALKNRRAPRPTMDEDKYGEDVDEISIPTHPQQESIIPSTIPSTFVSARQYKAIWAPHCFTESRAQLLSDFAADSLYWKGCANDKQVPGRAMNGNRGNNGKSQGPFRVRVSTMRRDIGTKTDYITIKIEAIAAEPEMDVNFTSNDIVLLTFNVKYIALAADGKLFETNTNDNKTSSQMNKEKESFVASQSNGVPFDNSKRSQCHLDTIHYNPKASQQKSDSQYSAQCIVGHTEFSRRSIDGLQLKVSRERWLQLSPSDSNSNPPNSDIMFLVRLGSNITALREFTALSRVETMPLLPFLLNTKQHNESRDSRNQNSKELLASMGGQEALGKGFVSYLERKYNSSQIAAIAAAAKEYGDGGFTLIKGPPGTGKTTTLVALLNSLHIRQFNKYFESVKKIVLNNNYVTPGAKKLALAVAAKNKPRILVCAPSNTAVDNIILKIMENGFIDGSGSRYNPTMIRVGSGQSVSVQAISLESKIKDYLSSKDSPDKLDTEVASHKTELNRIQGEIFRLRKRIDAIGNAAPWELSKDWEIRVDENFEENSRVVFVNHKEKSATYECPPRPEPGERAFPATAMPEYRSFMSTIVKMVDRYSSVLSDLQRCRIVQRTFESDSKTNYTVMDSIRNDLETHLLDSVHIVLTTLGTAGSRVLESSSKFEVVVIDEAAQSVEPSSLTALQLGSKHCILVGDPQQLPATIFSVSGKSTKYDRSLFQRLEEAGHRVYMLQVQYRMHPKISHFPRHIFYGGSLLDGPNVEHPEYGNPLRRSICTHFASFAPFTIFDLESLEERDGTSMSNRMEADFVLHLYKILQGSGVRLPRLAIITPYAQQAHLIRRIFSGYLKDRFESMVEVNTVDAFQGRESDIVIFSSVRASGCKSIGFLSDVRRMNVALTRAKYFLFVVARCKTISMNPYWKDLVEHAIESNAVVRISTAKDGSFPSFEPAHPSGFEIEYDKKES